MNGQVCGWIDDGWMAGWQAGLTDEWMEHRLLA